jgi:hypothetical protein
MKRDARSKDKTNVKKCNKRRKEWQKLLGCLNGELEDF